MRFCNLFLQQKILLQWRMRQTDDIARLNASQTSRKILEKQTERRWCSAKRFLHSEKGAFAKEWVLHFTFIILRKLGSTKQISRECEKPQFYFIYKIFLLTEIHSHEQFFYTFVYESMGIWLNEVWIIGFHIRKRFMRFPYLKFTGGNYESERMYKFFDKNWKWVGPSLLHQ